MWALLEKSMGEFNLAQYFQVFEYGTVIQDVVDIHYPVDEMMCNSKIR